MSSRPRRLRLGPAVRCGVVTCGPFVGSTVEKSPPLYPEISDRPATVDDPIPGEATLTRSGDPRRGLGCVRGRAELPHRARLRPVRPAARTDGGTRRGAPGA